MKIFKYFKRPNEASNMNGNLMRPKYTMDKQVPLSNS